MEIIWMIICFGLGYSYDDVVDDDILIRLARCAL